MRDTPVPDASRCRELVQVGSAPPACAPRHATRLHPRLPPLRPGITDAGWPLSAPEAHTPRYATYPPLSPTPNALCITHKSATAQLGCGSRSWVEAGESAGYNPASIRGSLCGAGLLTGSRCQALTWIAPAGRPRREGVRQTARPNWWVGGDGGWDRHPPCAPAVMAST